MKILHICLGCFYVDNHSYQENMLPKYHKRDGNEVFILASTLSFDENGRACNVSPGEYENEYGIPVKRLSYKRNVPLVIAKFLRLYEPFINTLERITPDIIFIHGCQFLDIYAVIKYLKNNMTTVYVDNHADYSNSANNIFSKYLLHKLLWRKCAQSISPFVTKFYGVLPARVDFLKNVYKIPEEKVELLVMGVDDEMVESLERSGCRNKFRSKLGIDNKTVIITGGKIDNAKKQVITFLRYMHSIQADNVVVLIFGSIIPSLRETVLSFCDGNKIIYLGWLDHYHTYEAIMSSDIAIYPGRHSVLWEETVGMGIPMVVKKWKGTTHVDLGGNVLFLEDDSESTLSSVMTKVLLFDTIKQMGIVAREKGKKTFSYRNIANRAIDHENF